MVKGRTANKRLQGAKQGLDEILLLMIKFKSTCNLSSYQLSLWRRLLCYFTDKL
ncbi:MAG: hypothetical protein ACJASB_000993 [Shewanella psychromarinicola]|jgi:hypothetical protein